MKSRLVSGFIIFYDRRRGRRKMECFIDGKSTCERTFWNRLNVLANFQQKEMIMDGLKVRVAESMYWIQPKKG